MPNHLFLLSLGLNPMIFTTPNLRSLKIIAPFLGRRSYLGNGESTSLMVKILLGYVEHFAIGFLFLNSWCCKYYTFSPTPQVFNITHSSANFYEYLERLGYQKYGLTKFPKNTLTIHQQPNINYMYAKFIASKIYPSNFQW